MLTLTKIAHGYKDREVLVDVDLELDDGVTALLGGNVAGKSTRLAVASGGLRPRAGSVQVAGSNLYGARAARSHGLRHVALMPQTAVFPGSMTVVEVVEYLTWMRGVRAREARIAARDALRRVHLEDRA